MMLKNLLRRDTRGIGAAEFALVAPVLISFVIGISQVGKLFYANADMKNALASGARVASIWPVPQDPVIIAAVKDRIARTGGVGDAEVTISDRGTNANGNRFIVIKMDYKVPLDFIFFDVGPVELSDTRQVFTQMPGVTAPPASGGTTTSSTTTGGTTTSTTSGGTTSTSATSAGGTTSTSATSAGGTTSTSATSASSTTSSTTSSSGNGNSNGNSSHGHGDCKKKCG